MANVVVYTSETPYAIVRRDFISKFQKLSVRPDELEKIHTKWTTIGKLARNGKLTGMKYV